MADVNIRIAATDEASPTIHKTTSAMDGMKTAADQLKGAFLAMGVGVFVKEITEAALAAERLQTVFKVASGSAGMAAKEMQFIREESNRLGLEFASTADAYSKFMISVKGSSIEGETARKTFVGISEGMAAMKKTGDESSRVFAQIQQGLSKGKLELEDLKIIAEAGIPVFQLLADATGKSKSEVMKMMSDGKLIASEVYPKLAEQMHKAFGKEAQEAAKGAQAEINRFKNAAFDAKTALGEAFLPTLVEVMKFLTWGTNTVVKPFVYALQTIGNEVLTITQKIGAIVEAGPINLITGGKEARDELREQFKAIDEVHEYSRKKNEERLNPTVSSEKSPLQKMAEDEANYLRKKQEAMEKAKADAAKVADEMKALDEQRYKNELQALQISGSLKLEELKGQFDQGKLGYQDYFAQVRAIEESNYALQIARAEDQVKNLKSKMGTPGFTEDEKKLALQKDIMAAEGARDKIVGDSKLKILQLAERENKAEQEFKALILDTAKARLEASGQYIQAVEKEIEKERQAADYLKVKAAASKGNTEAIQALKDKELFLSLKMADAQIKENDQLRKYSDEIFRAEQEIRKLNGADQTLLEQEAKLQDGKSKLSGLQDQLNRALMVGNQIAIASYNAQISAQDLINQRLEREIALREQIQVLTGEITGFDNGRAIYADSYAKEQAATGYISASEAARNRMNSGAVTITSQNSPFVSVNSPNPYKLTSYDVGTNYVPKDGLAYLHEGEAVVPKKFNQGGGGVSIQGDINFTLPNVTNQTSAAELARFIKPELQKLEMRYRKTA